MHIGWSVKGRYPELSMIPSADMPNEARDEFRHEEYLTRLPHLWSNRDFWWKARQHGKPGTLAFLQASLEPIPAEQARDDMAHLVDDATGKLKRFGIPYLEAFARSTSQSPRI